ncbi:bifunctional DNA primase/polymerase [beta proteobacterium MWH-UniP1]
MSSPSLIAAIAYAERSYFVLPVWSCLSSGICRCPEGSSCGSPGKHPQGTLVPRGHKQAITNVETIKRWYAADPEAGVAIYPAGSGLVVIDVDPRNGGDETLQALRAANQSFSQALDSTVQARTQSGGSHYFFKAPTGASYPATLGKGVDIKYNGYVCVEPTIGPSGPYKWVEGKSPLELGPVSIGDLIPQRAESQPAVSENLTDEPDAAALTDLRDALYLLDHDDYRIWINVGHALRTAGEAGYHLWTEWSKRSLKYDQKSADEAWRSFRPIRTHWKAVFTYKTQAVESRLSGFKVGGKQVIGSAALKAYRSEKSVNVLDSPIRKLTAEEVAAAKPHPRMLIEKYLYADLRNLIAPGGVGKTTLLLYEAVMAALGKPIWGRAVSEPFTTIIVTKEDSRELLANRIGKICEAESLVDTEKDLVFDRVYVIDLCGEPFRLAEQVDRTIRPDRENIEKLVNRCIPLNPGRLIFDPLVSFGAGEAQVNDSEQAIVEAARLMMLHLPGCAIDVVHHTGKQNARANSVDQYAGRNGTALPDGSRMVAVLNELGADTFRDETGVMLAEDERGFRLVLPKLSFCERQGEIFIIRCGYLFRSVAPLNASERAKNAELTKQAKTEAKDQRIAESLIAALKACQSDTDPLIKYPSRKTLLDRPEIAGKTASVTKILKELLEYGVIEERPLSADQIAEFGSKSLLGGRTTCLALAEDQE